jgi:NAD(P)-dependent dehydrogenase (short-subunit alcohol dehydrogenase family)
VLDMTRDVWDDTMTINVRGVMWGCKHAIPSMIERGGGSIINMSSGAAIRGSLDHTAYGVSKAAVDALTLYVAAQHGRDGIRCNSILPGLILTPSAANNVDAARYAALNKHTLAPRVGDPEDIAHLALYLASDEARFVSGQIISCDGGLMSHNPGWADAMATVTAS